MPQIFFVITALRSPSSSETFPGVELLGYLSEATNHPASSVQKQPSNLKYRPLLRAYAVTFVDGREPPGTHGVFTHCTT